MNEISTINKQQLVQVLRKDVGNLIRYSDKETLLGFCLKSFVDACIYRGINKTNDEIQVLAESLADEVKRSYAYLSYEQMTDIFKQNRYGADIQGISQTVSPVAFIKCLDNANATFKQTVNKQNEEERIREISQPKKQKLTKAQLDATRVRALKWDYDDFLKNGTFDGYGMGELEYIREYMDWDVNTEEEAILRDRAEEEAKQYYVTNQHLRYRTVKAVIRDYNLLMSAEYIQLVDCFFSKEKLKLFFKKVKNGEIKHEIFNNV